MASFKYNHSEHGMKKRKEDREKNRIKRIEQATIYHKEHPEACRKASKRYRERHPDRLYEINHKYTCSEKGKIRSKKGHAKAKDKKWIRILPNIFPKDVLINDHHVDGKIFTVPLPKNIHQKTTGRNIKKHIEDANTWVEFYYGMHPSEFITDEHLEDHCQTDIQSVSPSESSSLHQGH